MNPRHVGLRPVPPGSTIGVIAPAGPAHAHAIDAIARALEGRGFHAHLFHACHERHAYISGDGQQRLVDLHAAFSDPAIDAIICMRGGYCSARQQFTTKLAPIAPTAGA